MRNAARLLPLLMCAAAMAACGSKSDQQDNSTAATEPAGNSAVDIDTLPPDESVATPSADLANGVDDTNDGEPENGF